MTKLLAAAISLVLCFSPFVGTAEEYQRYSMSFFGTFDTSITIMGFAASPTIFDSEAEKAQQTFDRLHQLYDKYNDYPGVVNVRTLNQQAAKAPVQVEQPLFDLLKFGKDLYPDTNRLVNIAFGAVLELWHDSREAEDGPPDMDALMAANEHVNIDDLVLDAEAMTVFFKDPLLKLDVGAIAKGYAVEVVAQQLLAGDMPSFVVNAGGNVRAGQPPMDGRKNWGIAIQDPDGFAFGDPNSDILDTLFLHNTSVVTSGDYQRFFIHDGTRYHHIISTETLMPPAHFRSVTAVTEDSGLADMLSTALFLMDQEAGQRFVEGWEGVEALWIMNDRSVVMTDGLKPHARSEGASNPY